uniref:NACHT, LRR and PYD domains-containing protein 3-like n=1 Tax=Phallusia mammillata TaxID=59560 RepID=A0A6F9DMV7_9ASCI|nr:NACHT, LRR and PYD domains-containing protein 3-like [Phallusia mammillata]
MKVREGRHGEMDSWSIVRVCSWLQEIDDEKFYQEVAAFLPLKINLTGNILLTDVSSITEVLSYSETKHDIKISNKCQFLHSDLKGFLKNFFKTDRNIQIKLLDLGGNKVNDESASAIASYIHNIEELHLDVCELTSVGICKLQRLFPTFHNQLNY